MQEEKITLTMSQFDDVLKLWRKKGAEKTFGYVFVSSFLTTIPLLFGIDSLAATMFCAAIYIGAAFLSTLK